MVRNATYRKGDVILVEGNNTSEVYILKRGSVEVYREGPPEQRLAVLCAPSTFGEMALITEQPRSASIRALEDVEVSVLDCEEALDVWRTTPDALFAVTGILCERVRALNSLVTELAHHGLKIEEALHAHLGADIDTLNAAGPLATGGLRVVLEGLTPPAIESLGRRSVAIDRFPCRIGRRTPTENPFANNELAIGDHEPFTVSRNHCVIVRLDNRCFVIDRGSRLGTVVNGTMVGGGSPTARVELQKGDNVVALGGASSPYRFRARVSL
jgi:Cyclic nucleotide-binding domain/FHA domain